MSGGEKVLGGVNAFRAVAAALACLPMAPYVLLFEVAVPPTLGAMYALLVVYAIAYSFDRVHEHAAYQLVSAAWMAVMFALIYLSPGESSPLYLVFAGLMAVKLLTEVHNYRHGTSHLRID